MIAALLAAVIAIPGGYRVENATEAYDLILHDRCLGRPWRQRWSRPPHRHRTWRYNGHCKLVSIATEKGVWSADEKGRWCLETPDGARHCY
jgi:hypothetical protein